MMTSMFSFVCDAIEWAFWYEDEDAGLCRYEVTMSADRRIFLISVMTPTGSDDMFISAAGWVWV